MITQGHTARGGIDDDANLTGEIKRKTPDRVSDPGRAWLGMSLGLLL